MHCWQPVDLVDGRCATLPSAKNTIAERVAVMAALNIAHEHLGALTQPEISSPQSRHSVATSDAA